MVLPADPAAPPVPSHRPHASAFWFYLKQTSVRYVQILLLGVRWAGAEPEAGAGSRREEASQPTGPAPPPHTHTQNTPASPTPHTGKPHVKTGQGASFQKNR